MRFALYFARFRHVNRVVTRNPSLSFKPSNARLFQDRAIPKKSKLAGLPGVRSASLPFYVGTDICHTGRIRRLLFKSPSASAEDSISPPVVNQRFLERLFTHTEIEMQSVFLENLNYRNKDSYANFVAGRWAAKEAIIKASPPGPKIFFRDIAVVRLHDPKPRGIILDQTCVEKQVQLRIKSKRTDPTATKVAGEQETDLSDVQVNASSSSISIETTSTLDFTKKNTWAKDIWGQEVRISISHDGDYATAVAIVQFDEQMVSRIRSQPRIDNRKGAEISNFSGTRKIELSEDEVEVQ